MSPVTEMWGETPTTVLQVRVDAEQYKAFKEYATSRGMTVSSMVRSIVRTAAAGLSPVERPDGVRDAGAMAMRLADVLSRASEELMGVGRAAVGTLQEVEDQEDLATEVVQLSLECPVRLDGFC